MRIQTVRVGHFRCLQDCIVDISDFTALVGPNGVGKSTLLESLRYFFVPKYQLSVEDINPNCFGRPIEVAIRFHELNQRELELYNALVVDGAMEITKRSTYSEEGEVWTSAYQVDDFAHPAFDDIRKIRETTGAVPAKNAYNTFAKAHPPYHLEAVTTIAAAEENMRRWEIANADQCAPRPGRFEFSPKGGISLADCTQLIYIPAVREARVDIEGSRSPLQELLQSVILTKVEAAPGLLELRERFQQEYGALFPSKDVPELDALAASVTEYLGSFAPGSRIILGWDPDQVPDISPPEVKAQIVEDGFPGDVARKGHGVQRAVIVALVHALNIQRNQARAEDREHVSMIPDLLLIIEEPELYQHPTRARHFYEALRTLVETARDATRVQVIISTHSPYFVSLTQFESVRLLRRQRIDGQAVPRRSVGRTTLDNVAQELGSSFDPHKEFSGAGLAPRLHGILDSALREGFFADSIVLVEGVADQALLEALCQQNEFDFEAAGLAILPVNGKNSLDKALIIFRQLGIPVFVLFDGDASKASQYQEANPRLLRLLNAAPEPAPKTGVYDAYAVCHENLEAQLDADFGQDIQELLGNAATKYGYANIGAARKVPAVMREVLAGLQDRRKESAFLLALSARIVGLATQSRQANLD